MLSQFLQVYYKMKANSKSPQNSKRKSLGALNQGQSDLQRQCSSSFEQEIMIKNIDSGSYQVFNIQEVDSVYDLKKIQSAQTKVSLWNSYWDELSKNDVKLLKLVLNKDHQKLQKLLSQQPIELNTYRYMDGWTLLHHAVVSSSEEVIKILVEHKIDLNATSNGMKRSALHQSVLSNKVKIVKILIQNHADPNIQDIDGNTPTHYAAELSYQQIFKQLMSSQKLINFKIKNNQQMTILDCIRDQKLLKMIPNLTNQLNDQNQNQYHNSQNRRLVALQKDLFMKRYSKSDMVQKFLNHRNAVQAEYKSIKSTQFSVSIKSDSSNGSKKKHNMLGKKPSHWIQKKGQLIAAQSIGLMKQSVLQTNHLNDNHIQSLANYQILRFIGSGGFAEVFLARRKRSSHLFALKRINKSKVLENNLKRYVYSERNIMIKCNHPFIVEAFSMFQDEVYLYIAMEYCQCGDLQKAISHKGRFSEQQAKIYAAQIGLALEQIHLKNILFRDLKTANVLICKDGYIKVSDFGLAKQSLVSFSFLGSVQYLAPEMLVDTEMKEHTKSIDWYLFGVLIYQLVTGKTPFYGQKQHILFKKIRQQSPIFPNYMSKQCKSLLSKLLQKNPAKRLGTLGDFSEIKGEEWFSQISFHKILNKQYPMNSIEPVLKESQLRKKIPIDSFLSQQKFEYFKQWNYTKSVN